MLFLVNVLSIWVCFGLKKKPQQVRAFERAALVAVGPGGRLDAERRRRDVDRRRRRWRRDADPRRRRPRRPGAALRGGARLPRLRPPPRQLGQRFQVSFF